MVCLRCLVSTSLRAILLFLLVFSIQVTVLYYSPVHISSKHFNDFETKTINMEQSILLMFQKTTVFTNAIS